MDDEADLTPTTVKRANPASWITAKALAAQAEAVPDAAFRRYHCNQWIEGVASPGSLRAPGRRASANPCSPPANPSGWGVDLGGEWSDSAVAWVNDHGHVGAYIGSGEEAILDCAAVIEELAGRYRISEVTYDPWRSGVLAQQLAERQLRVTHFPMTDVRMNPASDRLHRAIVEGALTLPDNPARRAHAANAVARQSRRGWRIDKPGRSLGAVNIDGVIALMMAVDVHAAQPEPVRLLGFI